MKLLVTGGAGFIGSNFVRYWLTNHPEDEIVNLDVLTYAGNLENLKDLEKNPRHRFVRGDICDRELVNQIVKEVDTIVHFAAESHVDRSILGAEPFARTNVLGTVSLLDAAKEQGTRFHHVSTDEVFGQLGPNDPPFNENTPYDPRSPYSASKAASDHFVRAYHATHALPITISNCSNNYGPYMFPEKLIPLFISNLQEGKTVPVYGDGAQIRDWIWVEDHCRGIDFILQKGRIGETYCLGGKDAEISNLALTERLVALLGRDKTAIEFVKDRPGHDFRYAIDYTKAAQELGWEPLVDLETGLTRMVEWYHAHQDWVARCKSGAYKAYYEQNYGNKTV